jgi:hypothetical protein
MENILTLRRKEKGGDGPYDIIVKLSDNNMDTINNSINCCYYLL